MSLPRVDAEKGEGGGDCDDDGEGELPDALEFSAGDPAGGC